MRAESFGELAFPVAAECWLDGRRSIADATRRDYQQCIKPLERFFGQLTLKEIHIGHVHSYQDERKKQVGPQRINREVGVVLGGILGRAGLWEEIDKFYEALPKSKKKRGIALEPEEEQYLWRLAAKNARWSVIYWLTMLSRNTCLGTNEIRLLRLGAIDQKEYKWLRVQEGLKNDFRERTIRCNPDAQWALRNLAERAASLGASLPEHYLLPHRSENGKRNQADPMRPQSGFLWSWRTMRKELAKKYPHLAKVRFYDNRHTAYTRLMENPNVPYNAIEHMMGHEINSKMKRVYDHIRDTTLQVAADALASGHFELPAQRELSFVERKQPQSLRIVSGGKAVEK